MKKISLLTLSLLFVALGLRLWHEGAKLTESNWETFYTDQDIQGKVISSYPSKESELKIVAPRSDNNKKRTPSSVKVQSAKMQYNGRELIGQKIKTPKNLRWLNKYNPEWKNVLGKKLLRFQSPNAKVLVKKDKSVIEVKKGSGRLMELVTVSYLLEGDDISSFKAWVDSETGEVIRTWNKTIKDQVVKERKFLSPSGTL